MEKVYPVTGEIWQAPGCQVISQWKEAGFSWKSGRLLPLETSAHGERDICTKKQDKLQQISEK